METFRRGETGDLPAVGWRETPSAYRTVMIGTYRYGDPVGAFRLVEEDAIYDLAKGLLVKFSHVSKQLAEDDSGGADLAEVDGSVMACVASLSRALSRTSSTKLATKFGLRAKARFGYA